MTAAISFAGSWWDQPRRMSQPEALDPEPSDLEIICEDAVILVAVKPAGLPVQADQSGSQHLLGLLQAQRPRETLYLVHRLDRPVSGLIVLAKSAQAQTDLTRQMSQGLFAKSYRAVVSPGPAMKSGQLEDYLKKQASGNLSRVVAAQSPARGQKLARLSYQVDQESTWQGHGLAWLSIQLETGRHHQIRVQLAHAGCPIVNDAKYGGLQLPGCPGRLALQSCQLAFLHPASLKPLQFILPAPAGEPWTFF